jgi:hypothetical protein
MSHLQSTSEEPPDRLSSELEIERSNDDQEMTSEAAQQQTDSQACKQTSPPSSGLPPKEPRNGSNESDGEYSTSYSMLLYEKWYH